MLCVMVVQFSAEVTAVSVRPYRNLWIEQLTAVQVGGFLLWWLAILLSRNLLDKCLIVRGILIMLVGNLFIQADALGKILATT